MSNRPILITGCQRSGTTLLNLILDSHDLVRALDESEFDPQKVDSYLSDPEFGPNVVFKLPRYAHDLTFMTGLGGTVLWCTRDPRDTVASMVSLHLPVSTTVSASWGAHRYGADMEVRHAYPVLSAETRSELADVYNRCMEIMSRHSVARSREDVIFEAALCWRLKNELLAMIRKQGIAVDVVVYEALINEPREVVGKLLDTLELPWDDAVLKHHEIHSGLSVGGTVKNRPIDSGNQGKWQRLLKDEDLAIVRELCVPLAAEFGYEL